MKKHNGILSLWKFIFAIVIAFYHTNGYYTNFNNPIFRWGCIAVEFYFIVTGFYFAKNTLKEKYNKATIGVETFHFILKKMKVIFPLIVIIYLINVAGLMIYENYDIFKLADTLWTCLLLRNFGVGKMLIMRQLWYLGTMLISLQILYPLLKKYGKNLIYLVSPIIIVLGLGIIGHNYGNLNVADGYWLYIINPCIIRGLVDINIGMFLYIINYHLSGVEYQKWVRVLLTFLGEGLLLSILFITCFIKNAYRYDFIMLLMITIAVMIITSKKTYEIDFFSNAFVGYLEKISLYIFINHTTIIYIVKQNFLNYMPYQKAIIAVLVTILFSLAEERIFSLLKKSNISLKQLFIKNNKEVN